MRVVYVIPGMRGGGGAERSLAAMVPHLTEAVDLHIVTWTGRVDLVDEVRAGGAAFTDLECSTRRATVVRLHRLIRDVRADLVHTTLIDADVVGRAAAVSACVPVVSSLVNDNHGFRSLAAANGTPLTRSLAWMADAGTARLAVRYHALSAHVAKVMARRLVVARSRIDVIPRGREPASLGSRDHSRTARARAAIGVGSDEALVVAAARHELQKGLDILLGAVPTVRERIPNLRVLIAGRSGTQTALLKQMAADLEITDVVTFLGQRDDIDELMCAADVWCVPSRWEGFGSILLEAMALEVPVVASDVAAIREVAGEPPVFRLVPPDTPGVLAEAVCRAFEDADGSRWLTERGRARFLEEFSVAEVSARMVSFYERAIEDSRLSGPLL